LGDNGFLHVQECNIAIEKTGICYNISLFIAGFVFRKATETLINREILTHLQQRIRLNKKSIK